jgi:hypothetical protein
MITVVAAGIGLLVLVAIVVGIVDAAQAPAWREIAAERRARWEAKRPQLRGREPYEALYPDDDREDNTWDDD